MVNIIPENGLEKKRDDEIIKQGRRGATRRAEKEGRDSPAGILVVNDEEVVCSVLETLLVGEGHQIQSYLSAEEAIARLKEGSFDQVITDLETRRVDGLDVLAEAKELDACCEVIVIAACASRESAVRI